jgi:hypothetical protein
MTLGLPRRRTRPLTPTPRETPGGRAAPYGGDIGEHLERLYRKAAEQLERDGRIIEAAFVFADLLGEPLGAISLLERHDQLAVAAELAEGRRLDPDLVVRLWWRAGQRDRAVEVARTRGGFARAVERLAASDPASASELREAWVLSRRRAGDLVGAVEAAWPDERLRPLVTGELRAAAGLGGRLEGWALAHLAARQPERADLDRALTILGDRDPATAEGRTELLLAAARLPGDDASADRELASAAVTTLLREASGIDETPGRDAFKSLRERADPLLAADLPRLGTWPSSRSGPLEVTMPLAPGQLAIHDAVALGDGVLVASGEAGVRLLTLDGRVRSVWDVPTGQLVVADHGGRVLLAVRRPGGLELSALDLASRRVRRWATLPRGTDVLPSYDGDLLVVRDPDGLALVDATGDRPKVVWRELDASARIQLVERAPHMMSALIDLPDGPEWRGPATAFRRELWQWDLPGMRLRRRDPVDLGDAEELALTARGTAVSFAAGDGQRLFTVERSHRSDHHLPHAPGHTALLASGTELAVVHPRPDGQEVTVRTGDDDRVAIRATLPDPDAAGRAARPLEDARLLGTGFRSHAGEAMLWDRHGRILVGDIIRRRLRATLRTRV